MLVENKQKFNRLTQVLRTEAFKPIYPNLSQPAQQHTPTLTWNTVSGTAHASHNIYHSTGFYLRWSPVLVSVWRHENNTHTQKKRLPCRHTLNARSGQANHSTWTRPSLFRCARRILRAPIVYVHRHQVRWFRSAKTTRSGRIKPMAVGPARWHPVLEITFAVRWRKPPRSVGRFLSAWNPTIRLAGVCVVFKGVGLNANYSVSCVLVCVFFFVCSIQPRGWKSPVFGVVVLFATAKYAHLAITQKNRIRAAREIMKCNAKIALSPKRIKSTRQHWVIGGGGLGTNTQNNWLHG